jgi:tRNA (guanine10-N2)-dimethyltransferase
MRYLVELSGESVELAVAEAMALGDVKAGDIDGRALLMTSAVEPGLLVNRLALAWSVGEHLFSCEPESLEKELEGLKLPGESFRVRIVKLGKSHETGASTALTRRAGEILSARYRVDLEDPDVELRMLMSERLHAGILLGEIDRQSLESRKSDNRPFKHPISLHPKLARAMVNLTGIESGQTILDPFCGTGGILLEAGLMGCKVLGGDMDARMVNGTIMNLKHYGVAEYDVRQLDISAWPEKCDPVDAIATDPPYGRSASTAKEPIASLYQRAFKSCHEMLKPGGKLAIALPGEEHIALAEGFRLVGMYPVRVHRSLTRFFCIMEKVD